MPKVPKAFIHFKSKSEEERYMRIVHLVEQMERDTHDTFVKNLISTHRAEALERSSQDGIVINYEDDQNKR